MLQKRGHDGVVTTNGSDVERRPVLVVPRVYRSLRAEQQVHNIKMSTLASRKEHGGSASPCRGMHVRRTSKEQGRDLFVSVPSGNPERGPALSVLCVDLHICVGVEQELNGVEMPFLRGEA
eukprot:scaffold11_cov257-Pinguiococcus_pyrenoidosus.AAC.48